MSKTFYYLHIMGGLKLRTYHYFVDSLEPFLAARCEKICAGISFCPCIRNSSAPSPDTFGIAPPADTGPCKCQERDQRRVAIRSRTIRSCLDVSDRVFKYLKVGIYSSDLARIHREKLTLSLAALSRSSSWFVLAYNLQ